MRNTLREFLKLSRPLHSVSVVAKQAPLALSNAKVSCKHGLWLVAHVNKRLLPSVGSSLAVVKFCLVPVYDLFQNGSDCRKAASSFLKGVHFPRSHPPA